MQKLTIDPAVLAAAEQQYRDTMTAENRPLRDDVLTPFGIAMKFAGYNPVLTRSGGLKLRQCPSCKGAYFTKYRQQERELWVCQECKSVSAEQTEERAP